MDGFRAIVGKNGFGSHIAFVVNNPTAVGCPKPHVWLFTASATVGSAWPVEIQTIIYIMYSSVLLLFSFISTLLYIIL
jgi:hypothetical protein